MLAYLDTNFVPHCRLIEDAEEKGLIKPGVSTLVEITSGNTGIGLAYVAARKGYKFIAIMQAGYSIEKQILLVYLGAKVVLSGKEIGRTRVLHWY
jgi:cysteine synthase A